MLAEDTTLLGQKQGTLFFTVWKVSWTSCSHWFPGSLIPHKYFAEVAKFVSVSDHKMWRKKCKRSVKSFCQQRVETSTLSSNWPFVIIFQNKATVHAPSSPSHGQDIHLECLWGTKFFYNKQCFFACAPIFNLCVNCFIVFLLLLFFPSALGFKRSHSLGCKLILFHSFYWIIFDI